MMNGLITASPPDALLVTSTVHVLGWGLLVALVALPAVALAVNALRDAFAARPRPRRAAGLCAARG